MAFRKINYFHDFSRPGNHSFKIPLYFLNMFVGRIFTGFECKKPEHVYYNPRSWKISEARFHLETHIVKCKVTINYNYFMWTLSNADRTLWNLKWRGNFPPQLLCCGSYSCLSRQDRPVWLSHTHSFTPPAFWNIHPTSAVWTLHTSYQYIYYRHSANKRLPIPNSFLIWQDMKIIIHKPGTGSCDTTWAHHHLFLRDWHKKGKQRQKACLSNKSPQWNIQPADTTNKYHDYDNRDGFLSNGFQTFYIRGIKKNRYLKFAAQVKRKKLCWFFYALTLIASSRVPCITVCHTICSKMCIKILSKCSSLAYFY